MTTKTASLEIPPTQTTTAKVIDRRAIRTAVSIMLSVCVAVVLILQVSSLFVVPLFDSYRWWGDESWLMLEFRQQIISGVFHHPYALGATIHNSNGLLFGSMWITAVLYGIPTAIFSSNVVGVGRAVTLILSFALLFLLYKTLAKKAGRELALLGVLLVSATRFYLWTSHSARYDMITGLAVLATIVVAADQLRQTITRKRVILLGVLFGSSVLVTVHTSLVLLLVAIYVLWVIGKGSKRSNSLTFMGAAVVPLIIAALVQWISVGPVSLFGGAGAGGFTSNAVHIPAMHLFSRNVWVNSLQQKWQSCMEMGPLLPMLLIAVLVGDAVKIISSRSFENISLERRLCWLAVIGYLAFEGPQFFYLIFIAPVVVMMFVQTFAEWSQKQMTARIILTGVAGLILSALAISDAVTARNVGSVLTSNLQTANSQLQHFLDSSSSESRIRSRVLIAAPNVNEATRWKSIEPVTTQFFDFPEQPGTLAQQLDRLNVNYVEVFASGLTGFYIPEQYDLRREVALRGKPILVIAAPMIDPARNYFKPLDGRADTLLLYRWQ